MRRDGHALRSRHRTSARALIRLLAGWLTLSPSLLWAADATPPTTPVVTDDGTYTTVTTSLHAVWSSSDLESGIAEYQYLIRQDSTSGTIIVTWTSTGVTAAVTHTGLALLQGKRYYVQVKAKNGEGLWSAVGSSNGIRVDTTEPAAPGLPTEGASLDYDYDGDGTYYVYWPKAADAESGIAAYELQEQVGVSGVWTTLTTTATTAYFRVQGRLHNTRYSYQVRAKNGAGLWGPWSIPSDGVLIDKTAPSTIATVTDDGAITPSTTELHAIWTTSSDPESGVLDYQYLIRQNSTSGTIIVNWTSVGLNTEVTKTGLTLIDGKLYYVGVRARNGAGLYSSTRYSDGIRAPDPTPPTAPGQPTEGSSTTDYDYDGDGSYTVYWPAASDPDSGVSAYEVQERIGPAGTWTTLTNSRTSPNFSVSGRVHNTRYSYQARAKNGVGTWGPWSPISDGLLVDRTAPSAVTVSDDGATTSRPTTLHATWTASSDPESGVAEYQYQIRQGSTTGTIIVPYTSVALSIEVTRTGLTLVSGTTYFIEVRAKNGAGLYSAIRFSNGITFIPDTTPPVITMNFPTDGAIIGAQ